VGSLRKWSVGTRRLDTGSGHGPQRQANIAQKLDDLLEKIIEVTEDDKEPRRVEVMGEAFLPWPEVWRVGGQHLMTEIRGHRTPPGRLSIAIAARIACKGDRAISHRPRGRVA
jgi:hypothetical protein